MKDDEKKFFRLCFEYISHVSATCKFREGRCTPRDLISIIDEWMPHKRAWYYLEKWAGLGFYGYGVTLDLGWLNDELIPQRYMDLLEEKE